MSGLVNVSLFDGIVSTLWSIVDLLASRLRALALPMRRTPWRWGNPSDTFCHPLSVGHNVTWPVLLMEPLQRLEEYCKVIEKNGGVKGR